MKNFCKALSALFLFFICFSCSQLGVSRTSGIRINLPEAGSRGISSDQVMNYVLTVKSQSNSEDESIQTKTASSGETLSVEVEVGYYSVTLKAYDKDDTEFKNVYFEGSVDNVLVDANKVTDVSLKLKKMIFTVSFNADGKEFTSVDVKRNESVTSPVENPSKEGYTFNGWYLGEAKYNFETPVTKDITLEANWEKLPVYYAVTFVVDDKASEPVTVKENTVIAAADIPADPEKDGYKFLGWYLGEAKYNFETPVTKDITLEANWEKITNSAKVTIETPKITKPTQFRIDGKVLKEGTIELTISETMKNIKWYINGEIVKNQNSNVMAIDISGFEPGVIIVKCMATNEGLHCIGEAYLTVVGEN